MICRNPEERYTLAQVASSPWFVETIEEDDDEEFRESVYFRH